MPDSPDDDPAMIPPNTPPSADERSSGDEQSSADQTADDAVGEPTSDDPPAERSEPADAAADSRDEASPACVVCHRELPVDAPQGLCPYCLMMPAETRALGPFSPPSVEQLQAEFDRAGSGLEIEQEIGHGGMGAVYLARQPRLDRLVAVKILPPEFADEPGFEARFAREARALARLNHPAVVGVHDFGAAGPFAYLVMEYVEGINLRERLAAGPVEPAEALAIVRQICDALQYAHDCGVVHRDIKPENILLTSRGEATQIKIADFGLARVLSEFVELDPQLTGTHQAMGTPHYMAPEQFARPREVDHRADLFALGVVFYEMLTGHLPLGRFEPPSRESGVDESVDAVVLKSLDPNPESRYDSASGVRDDLDNPAPPPRQHDESGGRDEPGTRPKEAGDADWAQPFPSPLEGVREQAASFAGAARETVGRAARQTANQVRAADYRLNWCDTLAATGLLSLVIGIAVIGDQSAQPTFYWLLAGLLMLVAAAVRIRRGAAYSAFSLKVSKIGELLMWPFRSAVRDDGRLRPVPMLFSWLPEPVGLWTLLPPAVCFGFGLYVIVFFLHGAAPGYGDEDLLMLLFWASVLAGPLAWAWRDRIAIELSLFDRTTPRAIAPREPHAARWSWWSMAALAAPLAAFGFYILEGGETPPVVAAILVAVVASVTLAVLAGGQARAAARRPHCLWMASLGVLFFPLLVAGAVLAERTGRIWEQGTDGLRPVELDPPRTKELYEENLISRKKVADEARAWQDRERERRSRQLRELSGAIEESEAAVARVRSQGIGTIGGLRFERSSEAFGSLIATLATIGGLWGVSILVAVILLKLIDRLIAGPKPHAAMA